MRVQRVTVRGTSWIRQYRARSNIRPTPLETVGNSAAQVCHTLYQPNGNARPCSRPEGNAYQVKYLPNVAEYIFPLAIIVAWSTYPSSREDRSALA